MFFHDKWGVIFDIGDHVTLRNKKGIVTSVTLPNDKEAGYYTVKLDNIGLFIDYHYCFKLDIEETRNKKIDLILK
jgi:hypothetical protein